MFLTKKCKNADDRSKIFEFKSIWGSLTQENKNMIKSYMQLLCSIARAYFNLIYDNKVASRNVTSTHHPSYVCHHSR